MKYFVIALCFMLPLVACRTSKNTSFIPSTEPIAYTIVYEGLTGPPDIKTAYTRLKKEHLKTLALRLYGGGKAMRLFMEKNSDLTDSLFIRLDTGAIDPKEHFLYVMVNRPLSGGATMDLRLSEFIDLCE